MSKSKSASCQFPDESLTRNFQRPRHAPLPALASSCMALLFSVSALAHVRLDSPADGETLVGGQAFEIGWDAYIYHGPGTIQLEFTSAGGMPYTEIESGIPLLSSEDVVGSYTWTVPDVDSSVCMVRVTYLPLSGGSYVDTSGSFTIARASQVALAPAKDVTLYEDGSGAVANGSGSHLFAGRTGQLSDSIRRAIIHFDIAGNVPAGATISAVTLRLNMSRTASGAKSVGLHLAAGDWGEGASVAPSGEGVGAAAMAGDATWLHTFFNTQTWTTPGGDMTGGARATTSVSGIGVYSWSGSNLVTDVQNWLISPAANHGWFLLSDESTSATAKRFDSREHATPANRPELIVTFEPEDPLTKWVQFDFSGLGTGAETNPYTTVQEAVTDVSSNGTIKIQTGDTSELISITKAVTIEAVNGTVRIGVPGGRDSNNGRRSGFISRDWTRL